MIEDVDFFISIVAGATQNPNYDTWPTSKTNGPELETQRWCQSIHSLGGELPNISVTHACLNHIFFNPVVHPI